LHYGRISETDDDLGDDDATSTLFDLTLRGLKSDGDMSYGVFIGAGVQDDYGDADERMTYRYLGVEFAHDQSWGDYYAQFGFVDGDDEYNESTSNAPFLNVGGRYNLENGYALTGALAIAGGVKYDDEYSNRILDLSVGAERDFGNYVGFVKMQHMQIFYDDDGFRYGDSFNTLSVGITMNFGGSSKHGSTLPELGRWVAYNANEVE
jgi:hypothetical protein